MRMKTEFLWNQSAEVFIARLPVIKDRHIMKLSQAFNSAIMFDSVNKSHSTSKRMNYLVLNPKKSRFTVFASSQAKKGLPADLKMQILNGPVERSQYVKNLGVHIDDHISFVYTEC